MGEPDRVVARCLEIDGLFADLPAAPADRFTLLGCVPSGPLADVLEGNGDPWLGNITFEGEPWSEDLRDVTVLGHRASTLARGAVDIDVTGRELSQALSPRPDSWQLSDMSGNPMGTCSGLAGIPVPPPAIPVTLLGCQLDLPGKSLDASILSVTDDGREVAVGRSMHGRITSTRPSRLGLGLLDVTLDCGMRPMPARAREIWEGRRSGPPERLGSWVQYDRLLRHEWLGAALNHHRYDKPDNAPGATYQLDGRHVTDIEGFYCAIGEAINGPGGYFGWNLGALDDCLRGSWGARLPFTLVWHDSGTARAHLVAGYDRLWLSPAHTFEYLLGMLHDTGAAVELR